MSQAQPSPAWYSTASAGALFFANIALFQQEIEDAVTPETRAVIVDASAIVSVDLSAADRLVVLHQKLARRGVRFYLTEHIGQVNDELRRYGADSLIESGAVRRTLLSALQDCGLWSGPMPRPEEELRRQTQEFEWAYGDEAEERMEQLAAQTLQTLEHTESADRPEQLEHLIHSGRWHGEIDRDASFPTLRSTSRSWPSSSPVRRGASCRSSTGSARTCPRRCAASIRSWPSGWPSTARNCAVICTRATQSSPTTSKTSGKNTKTTKTKKEDACIASILFSVSRSSRLGGRE